MKIYSIEKKHCDINKYITARCKEKNIRTVRTKDRYKVFMRFFEIIRDDLIDRGVKVKLPLGVFYIMSYIRKKVFVKYNTNTYFFRDETEGYEPYIRWDTRKVKFPPAWKFLFKRRFKTILGSVYKDKYKLYIR